jgi:hypothetical protein
MRQFLCGDPSAIKRLLPTKVAAIKASLAEASLYFESNHCFIKGFGWFIPDYLPLEEIGVIVLKRDRAEVVESYWNNRTTLFTDLGKKWLIPIERPSPCVVLPDSVNRCLKASWFWRLIAFLFRNKKIYRQLRIRPPKVPQWLARIEREALGWYYDETYALGRLYQQKFAEIRYFEANLSELNSLDMVLKMFAHFGFKANPAVEQLVGVRANASKFKTP